MSDIFEILMPGFSALHQVENAIEGARKSLNQLENTHSGSALFSSFGRFKVLESNEEGISWEIELVAVREGTEATWHFEIQLMSDSRECILDAGVGFMGGFGRTPIRDVETEVVKETQNIEPTISKMTGELFGRLEEDCCAAIAADRDEAERFRVPENK